MKITTHVDFQHSQYGSKPSSPHQPFLHLTASWLPMKSRMRVLLLFLCMLSICWSQDSVTTTTVETQTSKIKDSAAGTTDDLTTTTTLPTTATATSSSSTSSSSQLPEEDDLVIGDEVPVTVPELIKDATVSDVIEEAEQDKASSSSPPPSSSEDDAANETAKLHSSLSSTLSNETATSASSSSLSEEPVQSGPFIDLLGKHLLSLEMIDPSRAQLVSHYTNEALANKKVVGLYFSADWYAKNLLLNYESVA